MKFKVLEKPDHGSLRKGCLTLGKETLTTPAFLTSAPCGAVPHLTRETLEISGNLGLPLGIPFNSLSVKTLEAYKAPMSEFMGLSESPSVIMMHDSSEKQKSGYNNKESVSVWSPTGNRVSVNAKDYIRAMKAARPDAFVSLYDADTPKDASDKRLRKSTSISIRFLREVLELSSELPPIIAPLGGGLQPKYREDFLKTVLEEFDQEKISGYAIEGFHSGGISASTEVKLEEIVPLVLSTSDKLPEAKPRFMIGAYDPWKIIVLIESGVDVFETSYPHLCAENGEALSFDWTEGSSPGSLNFFDTKYKNTFEPLIEDCACYACEHHTKAYLHHLLTTKELLAKVLLIIHNFYHFKSFFKYIARSIEEDKFIELKAKMKKYCLE